EDRVAGARVDAVRGEQRDSEVSRPEREAALAALDLLARTRRKPPRSVEPALVSRALERAQQRIAVAGGPVTDPGALLRAVRARPPDELRPREQQVVVERRPGREHDARCPGAPLQPDLAVLADETVGRAGRPGGEAVLDHSAARPHLARLALQHPAHLRVEQVAAVEERADVPRDPVRGREAAANLSVEPALPESVSGASSEHLPRTLPPRAR